MQHKKSTVVVLNLLNFSGQRTNNFSLVHVTITETATKILDCGLLILCIALLFPTIAYTKLKTPDVCSQTTVFEFLL